jgi:hypothetical protein
MKSENEQILKSILDKKNAKMIFQKDNIERILQRIPQNDIRMRQYMSQWLSCETEKERDALKAETYTHLSKEEKEAFTLAFHKYILVAERFKELAA